MNVLEVLIFCLVNQSRNAHLWVEVLREGRFNLYASSAFVDPVVVVNVRWAGLWLCC
jgi:hypothetical protein